MYQDEPADRIVILLEGRVKVTRIEGDGRESLLSIRDPGDLLGELSFVDGHPRLATVTTVEPVRALVTTAEELRRHLEHTPRVAVVLLQSVVRRFRESTLKRTQFANSDTMGRLAARIVELAERYGRARRATRSPSRARSPARTSPRGPAPPARAPPRRCDSFESWAGSTPIVESWSCSTSTRCGRGRDERAGRSGPAPGREPTRAGPGAPQPGDRLERSDLCHDAAVRVFKHEAYVNPPAPKTKKTATKRSARTRGGRRHRRPDGRAAAGRAQLPRDAGREEEDARREPGVARRQGGRRMPRRLPPHVPGLVQELLGPDGRRQQGRRPELGRRASGPSARSGRPSRWSTARRRSSPS